MKTMVNWGGVILVAVNSALAQSVPQSSTVNLDLNGDGLRELHYDIGVTQVQQFPPIWDVGAGVDRSSGASFLQATSARFGFFAGEMIGSAAPKFVNHLPGGSTEAFFGVLSYSDAPNAPNSIPRYQDNGGQSLLIGEKDFLLGVRLIGEEGTHYGWVKFSRPVVDNHTLFEIVGHDWNPIPGAAIPAGEPPGPPPVQAGVAGDGQLNFNWDQRAGAMVLEWADRLDASGVWQPVPDSGFPPVSLPPGEGNRFFRLRRP